MHCFVLCREIFTFVHRGVVIAKRTMSSDALNGMEVTADKVLSSKIYKDMQFRSSF